MQGTRTSHNSRDFLPEQLERRRMSVSFVGIVTGTLVAFAALALISSIAALMLAYAGYQVTEMSVFFSNQNPLVIAALVVLPAFFAFFWGGYAAGRMAQSAGAIQGVLVLFTALLIGAAAYFGIRGGLGIPNAMNNLLATNFSNEPLMWLISPVAALTGGLFGGILGANWYQRTHRVTEEEATTEPSRRVVEAR